jgi:hypothetical protein
MVTFGSPRLAVERRSSILRDLEFWVPSLRFLPVHAPISRGRAARYCCAAISRASRRNRSANSSRAHRDPLKPEETLSQTQRQAANDWFDHTLYSRLNDLGQPADPGTGRAGPARRHPLPATIRQGHADACADGDDRERLSSPAQGSPAGFLNTCTSCRCSPTASTTTGSIRPPSWLDWLKQAGREPRGIYQYYKELA